MHLFESGVMAMDAPKITTGLTYEQALSLAKERGEQVVPTFCGMCGPRFNCRVYAFVKDGKLIRTIGAAEGKKNCGAICSKGLAAPQWVYSPDRLTTPLLRIGERGEGKFTPISWKEAINRVADKLLEQKKLYGPESLAILSPEMRNYREIMLRFLAVHGSPNHAHSGICSTQRGFSYCYTLGVAPECDYQNSDLIIYWARQPVYAGPVTTSMRNLMNAKKRKATVVAIKPSLEPDSTMADIWMPLRPGTDAALALAMLHVIISEGLIDWDFVEKWCYGFDELREHVKQYTPRWAEIITGVDAQQIIGVARMYATTKAACIDLGNGVEHATSCCDASRAVAMLMAITGHLDRPGCNLFPNKSALPQPKPICHSDMFPLEVINKLVAPEFPLPFQPFGVSPSSLYYTTIRSILTEKPYPVRTIIAPGTQPTVSNRGPKDVLKALKKVDFYVCLDVTRTAEMAYADVVIPSTTVYEQNHPFTLIGNTILPTNRVVEPLGDYKSMHEFFLDLAVAMGYGGRFWNGSLEAMENERLQPYGLTVEQLRANPNGIVLDAPRAAPVYEKYEQVFSTKSARPGGMPFLPQGKVALYNTSFEEEGLSPMPVWREPPESLTATPELAKEFPLVLSDYHTSKSFSSSWLRNVPALREIAPYPTVHIYPQTAQARNIQDGDWVKVESPNGWLKVKAEYYEGIRPDTVMILHGWWQGCSELNLEDMPLTDGGANVNHLYSVNEAAFDPVVAAPCSQTLVEVSKYE